MGVVGRDTKYPLLVKYIKLKERRRKELTTDENGYSEHFCLSKGESSVDRNSSTFVKIGISIVEIIIIFLTSMFP